MSSIPVRLDLDQLRHQAKDLLKAIRAREPAALALLAEHREAVTAEAARLADAQHALARSLGAASWPRLVVGCTLVDAIHRDDVAAVRAIVERRPELLHEPARGTPSPWGPPMSYAANLGRDRIVAALRDLGARDLDHAFDRAVLQGRIATARELRAMGARFGAGAILGPAETLCADGLAYLLELGAGLDGALAGVLQTYARDPDRKHRCLEVLAPHVALPDTPAFAVHRGRADLLARCDAALLRATLAHDDIYPRALGCSEDPTLALHGTPLAGGTLLHLCVDADELELARWLLDRGVDPDVRAAVDAEGFGGHTALFGCIVSQSYRVGRRTDDAFARLLLERGASPAHTASLRKALRFTGDDTVHVYRDVTPAAWGARFHDRDWVNPAALALVS